MFSGMASATNADALYLTARGGVTSYDASGRENQKSVGVGLATELATLQETASVCPQISLGYSFVEDFSTLTLPVGIGIGTTMPLGQGGNTLTPHVTPQFIWASTRFEELDETESDTYFGFTGGATAGIGQVLVGASVGKVFEDGSDIVFGISGGFVF
jgi:hypothetical protein